MSTATEIRTLRAATGFGLVDCRRALVACAGQADLAATWLEKMNLAVAWWRSKASVARKYGRPLTWHSAGARVACVVREVGTLEGLPLLRCVARRVVG